MKIAIIGNGNVGGTLGRRWLESGHEVVIGVRDPGAAGLESPCKLASVAEAVEGAEVVVFALPYGAVVPVASSLDLTGKILVDCSNPIAKTFDGLASGADSTAAGLSRVTGSALVVKSFNTVGFNIMANPDFQGRKATMLLCGDDADAKKTVGELAADIGFEPVDAGPLIQAKWLESLAWLWISMALKFGHGPEMAFVYHKR